MNFLIEKLLAIDQDEGMFGDLTGGKNNDRHKSIGGTIWLTLLRGMERSEFFTIMKELIQHPSPKVRSIVLFAASALRINEVQEIFENRTPETGLENIITNDLIFEFSRRGRRVQKNSKEADAVLTGVIESERITTISRQAQQSPLARRVEIAVNLKLTDSGGGVKWSASRISEFEEYDVATDRLTTETNKRRAIETLSKKLAEKVHNRLTDDF